MANALVAKPQFVVRETGNLFAVTLDGIRDIPKIKVWWQEYLRQCWFIAKVTSIPVMLISIPFGMVIALHVGSFSRQLGAESATDTTQAAPNRPPRASPHTVTRTVIPATRRTGWPRFPRR